MSYKLRFHFFLQHKIETQKVWLLLFDLYLRHFLSRDPEETAKKDALFKEADLLSKFH